jgi:hypothetical protein
MVDIIETTWYIPFNNTGKGGVRGYMRRLFIALVLMFSLMGCATTSHNYASYSRSFDNDFEFYSQYGIAYKSGDFVVIGLFFF